MNPISRDRIIAETKSWLGTPYRHQAGVKGVGCDCLGLVRGVYEAVLGASSEEPPPYTASWAERGGSEALLDAAARHLIPLAVNLWQPGDVIAFRWALHFPAKHLAIASGDDRMIHAYDGACVVETAIGPWWRRRIAGLFAFPGVDRP